jgi:hypothetical protein
VNAPWLSVIMPTYNGEMYLEETLASIADQGDDGIEVVAVDDGSTDATLAILRDFARRMPLHIHARSRVGNWVANTNYGLPLARARHVCFLHQDDLWLPGRLRVLRQLLDREPHAALLLNPSRYIDARGAGVGLWRCPLTPGRQKPGLVVERLLVQNFIAVPAPVFSRDAALKAGGLNEQLWYTADWDFWLRLAGAGPVSYDPRPLTAFRVHSLSQTAQGIGRAAEIRRQLDLVLEQHLPPWEARYPERAEVGAVARLAVEVNHALAVSAHGGRAGWRQLAWRFLNLGPSGWRRFLRDSRIIERVGARLRARLLSGDRPERPERPARRVEAVPVLPALDCPVLAP